MAVFRYLRVAGRWRKLLGRFSINVDPNPASWCKVMAKNPGGVPSTVGRIGPLANQPLKGIARGMSEFHTFSAEVIFS